ncbi:unnamed protein product [Prorocentrum cordatum]|uniref:Uncharacterized protein n=1 Tax=Prorocentrum cordatum TaxID=2364126 RepID=A0ABN9UAJ6_9DINO|nr:unnamed protein product [Polarella glacialis]
MSFSGFCVNCCKQIPVVGLAFSWPPSYDDLEKMLQVYALLTGLVLSMVGGCIFENFSHIDKAADIYGALFGSLELLFLATVTIVCLYIYLMMFVTQENNDLATKQVRRWWSNGGRLIFVALPVLVFTSCWQFIMAVTMYFEGMFDHMDVQFDYGCMKSWFTLPIVSFLAFFTIHKSFLSAGWNEQDYESLSEDWDDCFSS